MPRSTEAESIAYVVCQHYGIDTSEYSFGYVAGWSGNREVPELKASLDTIRRAASDLIIKIDEKVAELTNTQEKSKSDDFMDIDNWLKEHGDELPFDNSGAGITTGYVEINPPVDLSKSDNTQSIALSPDIYDETMKVKKDCIIYDLPGVQLKKIAIVDLNERSLLDKDRALTGEILDKICNLLNAEEIYDKQLRKNLDALSVEEVRKQVIGLIELATTSCEHFAVRDILGAVSFILTACTTDEYAGINNFMKVFMDRGLDMCLGSCLK